MLKCTDMLPKLTSSQQTGSLLKFHVVYMFWDSKPFLVLPNYMATCTIDFEIPVHLFQVGIGKYGRTAIQWRIPFEQNRITSGKSVLIIERNESAFVPNIYKTETEFWLTKTEQSDDSFRAVRNGATVHTYCALAFFFLYIGIRKLSSHLGL